MYSRCDVRRSRGKNHLPGSVDSTLASTLSPEGCWPSLPQGHTVGSWSICTQGLPDPFLQSFTLSSQPPAFTVAWGYSIKDAGLCICLCQRLLSVWFSSLIRSLWTAMLLSRVLTFPPKQVLSTNLLCPIIQVINKENTAHIINHN